MTFENLTVENDIETLLHSNYPTENIKLKNIDFKESKLRFDANESSDGIVYPEVEIKTENVTIKTDSIISHPKHPIKMLGLG